MNREIGVRTPHTKAECLANAERAQKMADSYRERGWEKAAATWDSMADGWREKAESAQE